MIKIRNKKLYKGKDGIYIGRPSSLSNPFPTRRSRFIEELYSSEDSLKLYKKWLWKKIREKDKLVMNELNDIINTKNPVLICWCVDENGKGSCHGFIIRDAVEYLRENFPNY